MYLFNADINKHHICIKNAPEHIRKAWIFEGNDCTGCNSSCSPKKYDLGGRQFTKCIHFTGTFHNPTIEKLPDYIVLFELT